jgi:hypothetical protein
MSRTTLAIAVWFALTELTAASNVIVPGNGGGTAQMPIQAPYPGSMEIVDGLPLGSQINIAAVLLTPGTPTEMAGGSLGGTKSSGTGSLMQWTMTGTGVFSGFNRVIVMPGGGMPFTNLQIDAAPRMAFAPVQTYATELFQMQSQITGDPDFDLLRLTAGAGFGLPSPGQTKLTQVGPNWNVESFFDITYRIDFVGRPGGSFGGMSGSTVRTLSRFEIGMPIPEPTGAVTATLAVGFLLATGKRLAAATKRGRG